MDLLQERHNKEQVIIQTEILQRKITAETDLILRNKITCMFSEGYQK